MAGQNWSQNTLGGYFANPRLSEELRYQSIPLMRFRQFTKFVKGFGSNAGDRILFDKISRVATAGGALSEGTPIPETNFTVGQGQVLVTEYGNGIPYTGKLEALSQWNPEDPIQRTLRDDMALVLDQAAGYQFRNTQVVYAPTGTTTTPTGTFTNGYTLGVAGAPPVVSTRNLQAWDVRQVCDQMRRMNIPKYDGENYMCVGSILALRGIKEDTSVGGWIDASKYGDPERLFAGEVGRYYGVRFVEENNNLVETLGGGCGEAVFFGADAVSEAVAVPEELRYDVPQDAGRSKKIVWYSLLGFQIMWLWNADSETRIIRVWG
jgi:N4-gp56 family major capsid protein